MSKSLAKNSSLFLLAVAAVACNPLNKMAKEAQNVKYNVEPNPLEMHGDSVALTISGKYPPEFFPKKVTMEVVPVLREAGEGGNVILEFKPVTLLGADAEGEGKKIDFDKGGSFNYNDKIAYKNAMENAVLEVKAVASFKSKTKDLGNLEIGKGTKITAKMFESDEKAVLAKDKFVKVISRDAKASINYLINSDQVRPNELKDEDFSAFTAFLAEAKEKNMVIKGISIEAYASPDGELSKNENLATDRAESAQKAVMSALKKAKISGLGEDVVKLEGKGEDWQGFQTAMKASDIKDKDLILRILNMYDDVNRRETEIKNLAATYTEVAEKILPGLRRANIMLMAEEQGKSDEVISELAKSSPDSLTIEELLYAATLTEDIDSKLMIYKNAQRIYPNDWRGHNNVGFILLAKNRMADAKVEFEKALQVAPNEAAVNNNLGLIARQEGDVKAAKNFYSKGGAGAELNYNKGIINIIEGKYDEAVRNFGSTNDFNKALAQVLNKQEEAALKTLDASEEKDLAKAYYLKAIIGARTDNKELLTNNLKTAIKMDPALKNKAQKDAEFIKYRDDADFKAAL